MIKINFNDAWLFTHDKKVSEFVDYAFRKYSDASGPASRVYDHANWDSVDLPHDWAVALPVNPRANVFTGARGNSNFYTSTLTGGSLDEAEYTVGWYRKQFTPEEEWKDKRLIVEFEGVFRDAIVWVNGSYMLRHTSGYTGFKIDITDHIWWGEINSIVVRVDSNQPEGWWYEGAGIYRNVYLHVANKAYVIPEKTAIVTDIDGTITFSSAVKNENKELINAIAKACVKDADGSVVASSETAVSVDAFGERAFSGELKVVNPTLWSVDNPYLYTFEIDLGGDVYSTRIGVRTVAFDVNKGFLLNGKPVKVRGACNHQDFGGVGVALSDNLNRYKIRRLKDMGLNAYRTSHHAPSPALLDACDELGMLVMDETRLFGTSPEAAYQLTELIERDRNHPCVFIWSLGNEEFSVQNKEIGYRLMEGATRVAKALDPSRPVTYGGNNGSNFTGANGASEIRGFNYIRNEKPSDEGENWLDIYHKEHPTQPIIGTENTSYVLSRGDTVNDLGSGRIDSFGNVTMPWGSTPKGWVKFTEERDFVAGGFMWTGFDYRGEPNPFVYTNFSSSFGTIDLCGMEKPPFYYYKAWWGNQPVLKLASHWNFASGERARVAVATNCEYIKLFVNGKQVAESKVERYDYPQFELDYEAGEIEVVGMLDGKEYRDKMVTSGECTTLSVNRVLDATTSGDVAIYEICGCDEDGVFCPLASEKVELEIEGGKIVGVGNGDPFSLDPDQLPNSEEFVYVNKFNYEHGLYTVPPRLENYQLRRYDYIEREDKIVSFEDDFRDVARYAYTKKPNVKNEFTTTVKLGGDYEYIEFERLSGETTVLVNGKEIAKTKAWPTRPYRFYHDFKKGDNFITVINEIDERSGAPISGYVKIGKKITPSYGVKLHFGKARVFVKSACPNGVKLTAKIK